MTILYILLVISIVIFLLMLGCTKLILKVVFGKRCEGNPKLKYFTANDFKGLTAKPIEFKSNKGQVLRGNIYTAENITDYKGLIIFVHGMGGGHLSYTTEINTFAQAGFKVIGYDNTGTCSSEGNSLGGFFQAVIDLNYALKYVKENLELNQYPVTLVGHSWGAYAVCQVLQFKPRIQSVVAMSGFNNVSRVLSDNVHNETKMNLSFMRPFVTIINYLTYGKGAVKQSIDVIKESNTPVLLLQGDADKSVLFENSIVAKCTAEMKNVQTIVFNNRCHNIYQTEASERYLNDTFKNLSNLSKQYKGKIPEEKCNEIYDNIDYEKMTEEDSKVMNIIINFIEKNIKKDDSI